MQIKYHVGYYLIGFDPLITVFLEEKQTKTCVVGTGFTFVTLETLKIQKY